MYGNSNVAVNSNGNLNPLSNELANLLAKLIDEIDLYAGFMAVEYKQLKMYPNDTVIVRSLHDMKHATAKRIGDVIMGLTPRMSCLNPNEYANVIESIYQKCTQKWHSLKPIDLLRTTEYIQEYFAKCFGELQKRKFRETRSISQLNTPIERQQNITSVLTHQANTSAMLSLPAQNYVPYQQSQQLVAPPSTPPTRAPISRVSQAKPINSNAVQWSGAQQVPPQQMPMNFNPSQYHSPKAPMQMQTTTTTTMMAAQSKVTQSLPIKNTQSTAPPPNPISLYMQLQIGSPMENPPMPDSTNANGMTAYEKSPGIPINSVPNYKSPMSTVIDLTPNSPPALPINNDLPILNSADVADVLNEPPSKKARMENASANMADCGKNNKKLTDTALRKLLVNNNVRLESRIQNDPRTPIAHPNLCINRNLFANINAASKNVSASENITVREKVPAKENMPANEKAPAPENATTKAPANDRLIAKENVSAKESMPAKDGALQHAKISTKEKPPVSEDQNQNTNQNMSVTLRVPGNQNISVQWSIPADEKVLAKENMPSNENVPVTNKDENMAAKQISSANEIVSDKVPMEKNMTAKWHSPVNDKTPGNMNVPATEKVSTNNSNEKKNENDSINNIKSEGASAIVKVEKSNPVNTSKSCATVEYEPVKSKNGDDDDDDFEILIETYTEWKPKVEKIEKIEPIEEDELALPNETPPNVDSNDAGQQKSEDEQTKSRSKSKNSTGERINSWYDEISSDSDSDANPLIIDA